MRTVCAWCQFVIKDGPPEPVSHGVCPPCAKAWKASAPPVDPDATAASVLAELEYASGWMGSRKDGK